MNIRKTLELNFTPEDEKALEAVYDMFDKACDVKETDECEDCPLCNNCPLCNGNRIQAMKNFIRKIAE